MHVINKPNTSYKKFTQIKTQKIGFFYTVITISFITSAKNIYTNNNSYTEKNFVTQTGSLIQIHKILVKAHDVVIMMKLNLQSLAAFRRISLSSNDYFQFTINYTVLSKIQKVIL